MCMCIYTHIYRYIRNFSLTHPLSRAVVIRCHLARFPSLYTHTDDDEKEQSDNEGDGLQQVQLKRKESERAQGMEQG